MLYFFNFIWILWIKKDKGCDCASSSFIVFKYDWQLNEDDGNGLDNDEYGDPIEVDGGKTFFNTIFGWRIDKLLNDDEDEKDFLIELSPQDE